MRLHDLLDATEVLEIIDDAPVAVADVTHDSRSAVPGALFCCIPGARVDGHAFAAGAVDAGAAALLVEHTVAGLARRVPQARVASVRGSIGPLAARIQGDPSRRIPVAGVTGTNGKTTTTFLLAGILRAAGGNPAVIGTLGVRLRDEVVPIPFTTPEAPELQRTLAELVGRGADTVTMEVSSHALAEQRVDGTRFAAVCFTNLTREHLDVHGSLDEYFAAKARLFTSGFAGRAAINVGDPRGAELALRARAEGLRVLEYSAGACPHGAADGLGAENVRASGAGTDARIVGLDHAVELHVPLPGRFNLENALAAVATAWLLDVDAASIVAGVAASTVVPGRFEPVPSAAPFTVVVDYAHTPDGVATALAAARELATGRVIAVFGCGGDRDREKRPAMGEAAGRGADTVVLTSDNPRTEEPRAIAAAAARGLDAADATYTVELDRRAAIAIALDQARPDDVVMILGKGAESGQVVGEVRRPFDDRTVARQLLEERWS